jgi:hypothetical protein
MSIDEKRNMSTDVSTPLNELQASLSQSIRDLNATVPLDGPMHPIAARLCADFVNIGKIEHRLENIQMGVLKP